jgi:hypothetical protein
MKTAERVLQLYREKYFDFNVRHFHEKLAEEHGIHLSNTGVKVALQTAGLVAQRKRRGSHRRRRPRRPLAGMLLHIDASKHACFLDGRYYDRITILDDATSEVHYAQLVEEEGTRTVMPTVREVIEKEGIFSALYSDRASHFFVTPKAGGKVDRNRVTQLGRALQELGNPDDSGLFAAGAWAHGTELSDVAGASAAGAANSQDAKPGRGQPFPAGGIPGGVNRRFAIPAAGQGSAFVRTRRKDLDGVFSI